MPKIERVVLKFSLDRGALGDRMKAREFEAAFYFPGYNNPRRFFVEEINYRNPQFTDLIDVAEATADPEAIDHAYREMSDILRQDQPVAFLARLAVPYVFHRRVRGLNAWGTNPLLFTDGLYNPFAMMDALWLDERA